MPSTGTIFWDLLPLYIIMALGYVVGKFFQIDTKSIATIAVFVASPMVFLLTVAKMDFQAQAMFAPLVTLGISIIISTVTLHITRLFLKDKTPYLAALMSGTNNWGYFGVPLAFALFEPEIVGIYVVIGLGTQLFENSFGIYYISRGHNSAIESFKNIFRYPVIYAILIGIILSYTNYKVPVISEDQFFDYFKGAYVVLGMMMIGLGLADMQRLTVDWSFLTTSFVVRFLLFPASFLALVWADKTIFHIFNESFYGPFLLFSLMPIGANNISFAAKFDMNPGRAAVACLATTLFAMLYIPLAIKFLGIG